MTDHLELPLQPDLNAFEICLRAPANPHEVYTEIQARCPVIKNAEKNYTVTKMADLVAINRHPNVSGVGGFFEGVRVAGTERPLIPLEIDGPEHADWRRVLDPIFSPKRVAHFRDGTAALANRLIDSFIARGKADVYTDWCLPLPGLMFMHVTGLPLENFDTFVQFANDVITGSFVEDALETAEKSGAKAYGYFNAELDTREEQLRAGAEPNETIIDALLTGQFDGRPITRNEMLDILYVLVVAGLDTTTASLACSLAWLAEHPQERAALVADPSGWPAAIEELLRYASPVSFGFRRADKDITINEIEYPAGSRFTLMWCMANVDPDAFEDPTTVRFDRPRNSHIAFASGTHRCLGSHLARLELRVALEEFHRRIPHYRLDPDDPVVWNCVGVRKPTHLPIVWDI